MKTLKDRSKDRRSRSYDRDRDADVFSNWDRDRDFNLKKTSAIRSQLLDRRSFERSFKVFMQEFHLKTWRQNLTAELDKKLFRNIILIYRKIASKTHYFIQSSYYFEIIHCIELNYVQSCLNLKIAIIKNCGDHLEIAKKRSPVAIAVMLWGNS